jgi:outer membrane protein
MQMTSWTRAAFVAAMATLFAAPAAFAQAPMKIAYVNSQRILAEAPGRAEAEATYDREVGSARSQLQRMDDSLKAMVASFEKDAPALDSARREARGKAIRDREAEYSQRAQALNDQMQQRQAELAKPMLDQVSQVLDQIRTQGGYALILDVGTQPSVVVSADKSLDITDQVLARLKQLGPPRASATPTTTPAGPTRQPAGVSRPKP